jgi:hypothetical protein
LGEPVALVVADTLERATAAARLVKLAYQTEDGLYDLESSRKLAYPPRKMANGKADSRVGDVERGLARYREALDMVYPRMLSEPYADPFGMMLAASVVCAHVLHGRSEMMMEFVPKLAEAALNRDLTRNILNKAGNSEEPPKKELLAELYTALINQGRRSAAEIIETQFGYHIVKFEGRRSQGIRPYELVKEILVREAEAKILTTKRLEYTQKIQDTVKFNKAAIEAFAESNK